MTGGRICCSFGGRHLVIGEVTPDQLSNHNRHACGCSEFLRRLGHGKGRVRMPYPNPEGIKYYYFVPTSDVASVENSINTIKNRYPMCTHPTGGNPQYVPKPRLRKSINLTVVQMFFIDRNCNVLPLRYIA